MDRTKVVAIIAGIAIIDAAAVIITALALAPRVAVSAVTLNATVPASTQISQTMHIACMSDGSIKTTFTAKP